jgi:hypothetical protein
MRANSTIYAVVLDDKELPASIGIIMFDRHGAIMDSDEEDIKRRHSNLQRYDSRKFSIKRLKLVEA